jgi:hypothetical protein
MKYSQTYISLYTGKFLVDKYSSAKLRNYPVIRYGILFE